MVVEARQRVHAIPVGFDRETKKETFSAWPAEIAKRPEAGFTLGRMYLDGSLGPIVLPRREAGEKEEEKETLAWCRLQAGINFGKDASRYHGLTGIPFPSARALDLFSVGGHEGEVSEEREQQIKSATKRYMMLESDLLSQNNGRAVKTAVYNVCFMDIEEARMWYRHAPHMHALLITGLDALLWRYGLEQEKQIS